MEPARALIFFISLSGMQKFTLPGLHSVVIPSPVATAPKKRVQLRPGDWSCPQCRNFNYAFRGALLIMRRPRHKIDPLKNYCIRCRRVIRGLQPLPGPAPRLRRHARPVCSTPFRCEMRPG
jgi:hypothetical protein